MRFDVKSLWDLREAVAKCEPDDRIVIFPRDEKPLRLWFLTDRVELLPCDSDGDWVA